MRIAPSTARIRPRCTQLVDPVLLPHFDTEYAAQLVLGQHWTAATPSSASASSMAFYKSLLDNYGDALVNFTGDRLKVLPYRGDPAASLASRAHPGAAQDDGSQVAVNYHAAPHRAGLEGLGRGDRGHQLREELPRRFRAADRAEGARCRDREAREGPVGIRWPGKG